MKEEFSIPIEEAIAAVLKVAYEGVKEAHIDAAFSYEHFLWKKELQIRDAKEFRKLCIFLSSFEGSTIRMLSDTLNVLIKWDTETIPTSAEIRYSGRKGEVKVVWNPVNKEVVFLVRLEVKA